MFGGGAGHIADMIARIKANRELLKKRGYYKTMSTYKLSKKKTALRLKHVAPQNRKKMKKEIAQYVSDNRNKLILTMVIAIIIFVCLSILLYYFWKVYLADYFFYLL